jgi:hypothetical protein
MSNRLGVPSGGRLVVRPILPSRIWRGVCWALAIEAGAWAVVWGVLRMSSYWRMQ